MEKVYQLIDGTVHIRPITAADDAAIAAIIRDNLRAAHLDIPGTAYFDPELEHLSAFYDAAPEKRGYVIVTDDDGRVIGGVGFAEFPGVPDCAELQKLYLDDTVKGRGISHLLRRRWKKAHEKLAIKSFTWKPTLVLKQRVHSMISTAMSVSSSLYQLRI